jgi:hypothetical protein
MDPPRSRIKAQVTSKFQHFSATRLLVRVGIAGGLKPARGAELVLRDSL